MSNVEEQLCVEVSFSLTSSHSHLLVHPNIVNNMGAFSPIGNRLFSLSEKEEKKCKKTVLSRLTLSFSSLSLSLLNEERMKTFSQEEDSSSSSSSLSKAFLLLLQELLILFFFVFFPFKVLL